MLFDDIERLVELVTESSIGELTVQSGGRRITIRRCAPRAAAGPAAAPHDLAAPEAAEAAAQEVYVQAEPPAPFWIIAPMVGVFRDANPPVQLGSHVGAGQIVGTIESMKLMNDIRSEQAGIVREMLIEAGHAVEYGQPLFALEAAAEANGWREGQETVHDAGST